MAFTENQVRKIVMKLFLEALKEKSIDLEEVRDIVNATYEKDKVIINLKVKKSS